MTRPTRQGLIWHDNGFDFEPRWEKDPDVDGIRTVCTRKLGDTKGPWSVSFLAQGGFNKLYLVENPNQDRKLIMRVSLPVHPHSKTAGEVATLRWLRRATNMPVPEVFDFDDKSDNEIGFEWILMQLMPGKPAFDRWRTMSMAAKRTLVETLADYQTQIFQAEQRGLGCRGIGTLGQGPTATEQPGLQQLVTLEFFWGRRYDFDVNRGPFSSTHDWLASYIQVIIQEQTIESQEAEDDEDKDGAERGIRVARKLEALLPKIFPSVQNPPERTVLWHDDLSLNNILVDDTGTITAVIDWECVSMKPYWKATDMPKVLCGRSREEEPIRERYGDESSEDEEARIADGDDRDGEGKNDLYWMHLMEYEQTQLREVYAERMRREWPTWDADVADGKLKLDFLSAVQLCSDLWGLKWIEKWIEGVESGDYARLDDVLDSRLG